MKDGFVKVNGDAKLTVVLAFCLRRFTAHGSDLDQVTPNEVKGQQDEETTCS